MILMGFLNYYWSQKVSAFSTALICQFLKISYIEDIFSPIFFGPINPFQLTRVLSSFF